MQEYSSIYNKITLDVSCMYVASQGLYVTAITQQYICTFILINFVPS